MKAQTLGAGQAAGLLFETERAAVAVRRGREGDARHVGAATLLAARVAGHREGRIRAPVEARLEGHELASAAVTLGQAEGALDGLGAAVAEEALLQPAGGDLGELLGESPDRLDVVDVRTGVHELVGLRLGGVEHLRVVVAGVGDADAGEAVDVLGAVGVEEQSPVAVVGDHRLDALDEPGHDVVAVLFLHTHGIDHPSAHADATVDNGVGCAAECTRGAGSRERRRNDEQAKAAHAVGPRGHPVRPAARSSAGRAGSARRQPGAPRRSVYEKAVWGIGH